MNNKKKEEKKKRKLRTLILLLFLTIIMLGTSTYAWFTANRTVTIQDISVNVQTSDGLQISTDGKTWKSTITTTDILAGYDGAVNFIPNTLDAVSTTGSVRSITNVTDVTDTYWFNMYDSTIGTNQTTGDYTITTALVDETASPKKFVAFDVFLRVSSAKDVYINSDSGFSKVDMTLNSSDRGLKNASRVGFVPIGEAASDAALSAILTAKFANASSVSPKIWEPNNDTHAPAVINSVAAEYGYIDTQTPANSLLQETATAGLYNPLPYTGISSAITTQRLIDIVNPTVQETGTALVSAGTASTDSTTKVYSTDGILLSTSSTLSAADTANNKPYYKIFSLSAGITKMRIYMWVEGQDLDCENNASGTDITFHLELTIPEATQSQAQGG